MKKKKRKSLDECIFNDKDTIHYIKGDYRVPPDCKRCDGYGKDARKYGWTCYVSHRMEEKKREELKAMYKK